MHSMTSTSTAGAASTTGAAVSLTAGIAIVTAGVITYHPPLAIAGTCLAMIALAAIILLTVRSWIADVSAERAQLHTATREQESERARYAAAQAALAQERARLRSDLADAQIRMRQQLEQEREAMRQEFEDHRAELIRDSFEQGARMVRDGLLDDPAPEPSNTVVRFPSFPAQHERARHPL